MDVEIYEACRKKAKEMYEKTKSKKDLWQHVKNVESIADIFLEKVDFDDGIKYAIKLGCILHDIGKTNTVIEQLGKQEDKTVKKHHENGAEYLKDNFFDGNTFDDEYDWEKDTIINMVRYHKGEFPKAAFSLESTAQLEQNIANAIAITIVRFADKFADKK